MELNELLHWQKKLMDLIWEQAKRSGLDTDNIHPIGDGIADEEGYLASLLKIAFFLKEPYDDFDEANNPCGGGWSLVKDCLDKEDAWRNPVWQTLTYILYGFKHNLYWDTLPTIKTHRDMMNELKSIAWVNASKMPARTSSRDAEVARNFDTYWKEIDLEQLQVYNPDVIIFGKTFDFMKGYFPGAEFVKDFSNEQVWYYRWNGKILLDTYHPGRKGQKYVDALITALHTAREELAK